MSEKPAIFTIWRDPHYLGGYEIVCWVNDKNTTVQANIRTREKAEMALRIWRDREKKRVGA